MNWLLRIVPVVVCLGVYWPGIQCWFRMDDFAWLGLWHEIHTRRDLLLALFEPRAQGAIRVISERLFFLSFYHWFGMDALPFRILVFATQAVNLLLVGQLAWKLTGHRWSLLAAPLIWGVNPALSAPMTWSSVYNQTLCACALLTALLLFIRYTETGARKFYWLQVLVFVIGFGVLEINAVYPGLALAWAVLRAPGYWKPVLPLFAVSGAYTLIHNHFAPKQRSGLYALLIDWQIPSTLGSYWVDGFGTWLKVSWILAGTALAFVGWRIARRDWAPAFAIAWFVLIIGPILPLRNHYSHYYLGIPTIGLGLLGAAALSISRTAASKLAVLATFALYGATAAPESRRLALDIRDRTREIRQLVLGVEHISKANPGKLILLSNVSSNLFWWGMNERPFRLLGIDRVFLVPGSETSIPDMPEYGDIREHILPPGQTVSALNRGQAVVYTVSGRELINVTRKYHAVASAVWRPGLAAIVRIGDPVFADQLVTGWRPIETSYRWMEKRGVLRLSGPEKAGSSLRIEGYCPAVLLKPGPLEISVSVDGVRLGASAVSNPDVQFQFDTPLPASLAGKEQIEVALEASRGFPVEGEAYQLGVVITEVSIR